MAKALTPPVKLRFPQRSFIHLILIAVIGILAYSNTLHMPFQFDDEDFILMNPIVKGDFSNFLEPSKAKNLNLPVNVRFSLKTRLMSYMTFWVNFKVNGFNVLGYHVFNISIHILNAVLVYFLIILTFRTPYFEASTSPTSNKSYIALFSALLFVSHPVQTEAITYITQRFTSLLAFFYLLSLVFYIKWRLTLQNTEARSQKSEVGKYTSNAKRYTLYAVSLISAVLAMKTKENAFTLPLIIALYEFMFFNGSLKRRLIYLIPFLLTMIIVPLSLMDFDKTLGEAINRAARTQKTSRWDYLFTEFTVIVTYIRLLFLPTNQNLDYDYPIYKSFFNPQVFLPFSFLLGIFCFGIYLLYRSRFKVSNSRIIAFGIFWFFITLAIESSVIPLYQVIFEHRVYLPSIGAFVAITSGIFFLSERVKNKKIKIIAASSLILMTIVFSYAAYARNAVWKSDISLWEDVVSKSPKKASAQYNLGLAYASKGLNDEAIEYFQTAINLKPDYAEAHNNLGAVYISKGLNDKAIEHLQIATKLKPNFVEAYNNLGLAYEAKGLLDKAIEQYQIALRLNPNFAMAHYSLGIIYKSKGLADKAEEHFSIAKRLRSTL